MTKQLISMGLVLVAVLALLGPIYALAQGTNIVVESVPKTLITQTLLGRVQTSWPWYLTRAAGLVAAGLLVILMLSGIGFVTGQTFKFLEPITAWASHRALGIALGIAVLLHLAALYFDNFIKFNLRSILIPFASDYKPPYVALGIFAFYLLVAVVLTSLFWIDKKPKTWKAIHLLTYLAMVLVFIHALYLGTDLAQGFWRWLWLTLGGLVAVAAALRLWRAKTV